MAKAAEITVQVNAKLDVDEKTAITCLHLLEIYINNAGLVVSPVISEDGKVELVFSELKTSVKSPCPICGSILY